MAHLLTEPTPFYTIIRALSLGDPNLIFIDQELLIGPDIPDPEELQAAWEGLGGYPCGEIPPLAVYGVYYLGSFQWAALCRRALPYLFQLLRHPCPTVRYWAAASIARINVEDDRIQTELARLVNAPDPDPAVVQMARLGLRRYDLMLEGRRNIHLTTVPTRFYTGPSLSSPSFPLPVGAEIRVVRYRIDSPSGEEGPRGGLQVYDQILLVRTGQVGFLPRSGFDEILFV